MKRYERYDQGLLLAGLMAVAVWGCARGDATDSAESGPLDVIEVRTVKVERSELHASMELVGSLIPFRFASIVSEVSGKIKRIPKYEKVVEYELDGRKHSKSVHLDIGHPVRKGEILVEIDPIDHELTLKEAQARLSLAEKQLDELRAWKRPELVEQLEARLEEAAAVLVEAEADLKRSEKLLARKVVSQDDYEESLMSMRTAKAGKRRTEAALKVATAGPTKEAIAVAEARIALARSDVATQAEMLAKCVIRCPYDAVICDRYVGEGDRVTDSPPVPIMQIIDPTVLFAQVAVPEKYQGKIRQNDAAEVRTRDGVVRVPGVVAMVNGKIDRETRTFRVRVAVDNSRGFFTPGLFVSVVLSIDSRSDALVVPVEAMTFFEGQAGVFVHKDGYVEKRAVTLGICNRTHREIVSGLAEGEEVVVSNTSLLSDGLRVRVQEDGLAPAATPGNVSQ